MIQVAVAYIVAVIFNRAFNWLWTWGRNPKAGPLAYYREHGPMLAATALLHLPIFVMWYSGMLLPIVNGAVSGALKGVDLIPGVDLTTISLPAAVTPAVTLVYGWPIDSIVSRLGMLIGSKFAIFGSPAQAPTNGKETQP